MSYETPKNVEITSLYFRSRPEEKRLQSFPKRMVYDGREYNFLESSMQFLILKGQALIRLFDVSDGQTMYRLRLENNAWTLVGTQTGRR